MSILFCLREEEKVSPKECSCALRCHLRPWSSSVHLCLSLPPFFSLPTSLKCLPSKTSPHCNVSLVPVSCTFSGNSHHFFCTCKHTSCLLLYLKKQKQNKQNNPTKPKPTKPLSTWIPPKFPSFFSPLDHSQCLSFDSHCSVCCNQTSILTETLLAKGRSGFLATESSSPFLSSHVA